jgi:flagellar biosynthesis protein FlhA
VVGFIIFIIIIAVQAIVITKGATRIAEVAARFTLDGMPVKQMAIESEFNSGAINEEEARRRKEDVQREVDFYGQMDGASKFVSGNVTVGIFISVINLVGGFIVGMVLHAEPFQLALTTYTSLTIGDGLVSQLPALLVSRFDRYHRHQGQQPRQFWLGGYHPVHAECTYLLDRSRGHGGSGILPGFPWYVLLPMAGAMAYLAWSLSKGAVLEADKERLRSAEGAGKKPKRPRICHQWFPLIP